MLCLLLWAPPLLYCTVLWTLPGPRLGTDHQKRLDRLHRSPAVAAAAAAAAAATFQAAAAVPPAERSGLLAVLWQLRLLRLCLRWRGLLLSACGRCLLGW